MYISAELEIISKSKIVSNCFYKKNHNKSCFLQHINYKSSALFQIFSSQLQYSQTSSQ